MGRVLKIRLCEINHADGLSSRYKASALMARSIPEMQVSLSQLRGQTNKLWNGYIYIYISVSHTKEATQKKFEDKWNFLHPSQAFFNSEVEDINKTLETNAAAFKKQIVVRTNAPAEVSRAGCAWHSYGRQLQHDRLVPAIQRPSCAGSVCRGQVSRGHKFHVPQ